MTTPTPGGEEMSEKKKIVSERVYSDGKLDSRVVTITRWTEKDEKLISPTPVAGFNSKEVKP
jgi:hypothetical protein